MYVVLPQYTYENFVIFHQVLCYNMNIYDIKDYKQNMKLCNFSIKNQSNFKLEVSYKLSSNHVCVYCINTWLYTSTCLKRLSVNLSVCIKYVLPPVATSKP